MAKETVIIGCKLPSGITLEIGLQTTEKVQGGGLQTAVVRGPEYQRIVLKGWHHHNTTGLQMPAGYNMRPYLNRGIDKAAWEEWKRTHAGSWLLKNEILFEAKDEASAQLRVLEGDKTPAPFAPIIPKKDAKAPNALPPGIETAEFDKA
jgi:hypothetical protein